MVLCPAFLGTCHGWRGTGPGSGGRRSVKWAQLLWGSRKVRGMGTGGQPQGPGVMGTEARISQQPDQKTTIRGWDIQGAVLHTIPSMLPSASEPPDFIPCLQELPSTGLTQPSCFLPSSRLPQSAATLPPQGTDICPPSQLPFPLHSSFISRLECRTSLFQEPLQDGPRDPHSPQRPLWV